MRFFTALFILTLLVCAQSVMAGEVDGNVGVRVFNRGTADSDPYLDLSGNLSGPLVESQRLSWYAFFQTRSSWAQAYGGLRVAVLPSLTVYLGTGWQQDGEGGWLEQVNLGLEVSVRKVSFWIDTELDHRLIFDGNTEALWYEAALMDRVSDFISFGIHVRSGFGSGPHLDLRFGPGIPVRLFVSWLPLRHEFWDGDTPLVALDRGYGGIKFIF